MQFVGHLDLMKTFDRACRRAALPVSGAPRLPRGPLAACTTAACARRGLALLCFPLSRGANCRLTAPASPHRPAADESPFAVRQRIYAALPLPLGATSTSEWLEVTLTERFEPEDIRRRLQVGWLGAGPGCTGLDMRWHAAALARCCAAVHIQ